MPLPKLRLIPARDGYQFAYPGDDIRRAKPGSGPSRQRLDMLGAPMIVGVTFRMNAADYQYWIAFSRSTLSERSLPFLIDLIVDTPDLQEYEARIIPGTVQGGPPSGFRYVVQMQLEVKQKPVDPDISDTLVWLYEAYGDGAWEVLYELEQLVNFHFSPG